MTYGAPTPADLAARMSELITRWRVYTDQMKDWLAGTPDGGPEGNGKYPLTDATGITYMILCPAAQEALVTSTVGGVGDNAERAEAAAVLAQASRNAAQTAAAVATSQLSAIQEFKELAEHYADTAGSHAANALVALQEAERYAERAMAAISEEMPDNPLPGQTWIDLNTGTRYTWVPDPDGYGHWIEFGNAGVPLHSHDEYIVKPANPADGSALIYSGADDAWNAVPIPTISPILDGGNF